MQLADLATHRDPELVSGNIFIRKHPGKAGAVIGGHTHRFDHTTIVFTGSVRIVRTTPDGETTTQDFHAPSSCLVKAEDRHEMTFLTDGELWCVYSHRDPQGRITQDWTGWYEAYR